MTPRWSFIGPRGTATDSDMCGMPTGWNHLCQLSGDDPHENGCQPAVFPQQPPRSDCCTGIHRCMDATT